MAERLPPIRKTPVEILDHNTSVLQPLDFVIEMDNICDKRGNRSATDIAAGTFESGAELVVGKPDAFSMDMKFFEQRPQLRYERARFIEREVLVELVGHAGFFPTCAVKPR